MKQTSMTRTRLRTVDLAYAALFAVLLMVCAWINIPLTVPFTLQTFGVFAALGTLGGRRGILAILAYLLLGLVGLPVFSGFQGGPGVLLGTTGGYILGFLASALLYWGMTGRPSGGDGRGHGAGPAGVLCLRHRLVPGGLCPGGGAHRPVGSTGNVRVPLCGAGPGEAGLGVDAVPAASGLPAVEQHSLPKKVCVPGKSVIW